MRLAAGARAHWADAVPGKRRTRRRMADMVAANGGGPGGMRWRRTAVEDVLGTGWIPDRLGGFFSFSFIFLFD